MNYYRLTLKENFPYYSPEAAEELCYALGTMLVISNEFNIMGDKRTREFLFKSPYVPEGLDSLKASVNFSFEQTVDVQNYSQVIDDITKPYSNVGNMIALVATTNTTFTSELDNISLFTFESQSESDPTRYIQWYLLHGNATADTSDFYTPFLSSIAHVVFKLPTIKAKPLADGGSVSPISGYTTGQIIGSNPDAYVATGNLDNQNR